MAARDRKERRGGRSQTAPAGVERLRQRVERWRRTRARRGRMPEALWRSAVGLARRHGVNAVARALRLDYYALQRRLQSAPEKSLGAAGEAPQFVALDPWIAGSGCRIELVDEHGARLTLQGTEVDVPALVAAFFERGR